MSPSRPTTRPCSEVHAWDLIWHDDHGWGLGCDTEPWNPTAIEFSGPDPRYLDAPDDSGVVFYPDAGISEPYAGEQQVIADPAKVRDLVLASIARAQDPTRTAVRFGYFIATAETIPGTFPLLSALSSWNRYSALGPGLDLVEDWVTQCCEAARTWSGVDFREIRERCANIVALLQQSPSIFGRIASATMAEDLEGCIARRQVKEADQLLARLDADLIKAATARGRDGALRRFRAAVALQRHRFGPECVSAWDEAEGRGVALAQA